MSEFKLTSPDGRVVWNGDTEEGVRNLWVQIEAQRRDIERLEKKLDTANAIALQAARDAHSALTQRTTLYRLLSRVLDASEAPTLREFEEQFDPLVEEIKTTLNEMFE